MEESRPPLPPFSEEQARQKVAAAEAAWNTRDPERVALAYTEDTEWRNRAEYVRGRDGVRAFLAAKWRRELDYRLRKYYWAHAGNRIAVCFEYEYHDASGQWWRAYGNEQWEFAASGLMRKRVACINEAPIQPHERRIAVDDGSEPPPNRWLAEQGVGGPFPPPGGGAAATYPAAAS